MSRGLTFQAKSTGAEQSKVAVGYGQESTTLLKESTISINTDWTIGSIDFSIGTYELNQAQIRFTITGSWADVPEFDITEICLVKVG